MKTTRQTLLFPVLVAIALSAPACDMDVPNLNALDLEEFQNNPTLPTLAEYSVGLMIGHRAGKAGGNGLVSILGVIGRESYNFDPADPRYITELLEAEALDGGSPAFGGNFWTLPYRNIRNSFIIEASLEAVPGLTEADNSSVRGYMQTVRALDFLTIAVTRWNTDVPIDVNRDDTSDLAPLEPRTVLLDHIADLLDEAQGHLAQGGPEFPFALSLGFAGFDTPATFIQFNRAIAARVDAYREDWQGVMDALGESFISSSAADFNIGAYHVYSTGAGDAINGLSNPNLYVHPAVMANAELKPNGAVDNRVAAKVVTLAEPITVGGSLGNYSSSSRFAAYQDNVAPLAIIRNEELVLLRAEANIGMGNYTDAETDINLVRTASGGLDPVTLDANNAVDELLQQRFYSLLFEGGHRWIDMRRYGRLDDLLLDDENQGQTAHDTFPLPVDEVAARNPT